MDAIRDALLRMYRTAKMAKKCQDAFDSMGYSDGLYAEIYGNAVDAIYCLLGEQTKELKDSVTYLVMGTVTLSEERAVDLLYNEYVKNNTLPEPCFILRSEMAKSVKRNGGYMAPEGDWT